MSKEQQLKTALKILNKAKTRPWGEVDIYYTIIITSLCLLEVGLCSLLMNVQKKQTDLILEYDQRFHHLITDFNTPRFHYYSLDKLESCADIFNLSSNSIRGICNQKFSKTVFACAILVNELCKRDIYRTQEQSQQSGSLADIQDSMFYYQVLLYFFVLASLSVLMLFMILVSYPLTPSQNRKQLTIDDVLHSKDLIIVKQILCEIKHYPLPRCIEKISLNKSIMMVDNMLTIYQQQFNFLKASHQKSNHTSLYHLFSRDQDRELTRKIFSYLSKNLPSQLSQSSNQKHGTGDHHVVFR